MNRAWDAWCRTSAYLEQHLVFTFGLIFTIVLVLVLLTITTQWPDALIWAAGPAAGGTLGSWLGRWLRPPAPDQAAVDSSPERAAEAASARPGRASRT